jgi:uncharacterized protein (DUF2249 family)
MAQATLDLTTVASSTSEELVSAFDALPLGGTLRVIATLPPRKLLPCLIGARWGKFDWALVRERDGRWEGRLQKRRAPMSESLSAFLEADHRRCDSLYGEVEAAARAGDAALTQALAEDFAFAMRHHFTMEEEGFFQEFDTRNGMIGGGPTSIMRDEHEQMRGLLDRLVQAAGAGELDEVVSAGETLLILMEQHNLKEEQMLYPMADETFAGVTEELIKRMMMM